MASHTAKVEKDCPHSSGGGLDDLMTPIWIDDIPEELWELLLSSFPGYNRLIQKVRFKLQENQAKSVNANTVLSLLSVCTALFVVKNSPVKQLWSALEGTSEKLIKLAEEVKGIDIIAQYYDIPNETRVSEIIQQENKAREQRILAAIHASRDTNPPDTTHFKQEKGEAWKWHGSGDPDSGDGEWILQTFKEWPSKS